MFLLYKYIKELNKNPLLGGKETRLRSKDEGFKL